MKNEKEIINTIEKNEWTSIKNSKSHIKNYVQIARETLRKDKRLNIRLSSRDLELIQRKAVREGIPYQTLITSIIHKYVTNH